MKRLILYGAAFFDILKLIDAINREKTTWQVVGFIDDTPEKQNKIFWGYPVLGGREVIAEYASVGDVYFFNNVCGNRANNTAIAALLAAHHCRIVNLIHPRIDLNYVTMGKGCILPEGCVVGGNTVIGDFVSVRLGSIISHDVAIGNHVFIGPGVTIGSECVIEEGAFIGAGATIMLKRRIGAGATVGAGSLVNRDVPAGIVVAGVPAKPLKKE